MTTNDDETGDLGTYSAMLAEYLADGDNKKWIGPAELPLVFHLRKLCQQLDLAGAAAAASLSSAYLQAFSRLDKRRPGYNPSPGDLPGQGSIFDEMD